MNQPNIRFEPTIPNGSPRLRTISAAIVPDSNQSIRHPQPAVIGQAARQDCRVTVRKDGNLQIKLGPISYWTELL